MMRLLAILVVGVCLAGCGGRRGEARKEQGAAKVWIRDALEDEVKGKKAKEVRALLGRPDEIDDAPQPDNFGLGGADATWRYDRPLTRRGNKYPPDRGVFILFTNGRVSGVGYLDPR